MALSKLEISPNTTGDFEVIKVLFNPNTYSITKNATWTAEPNRTLNAPPLTFSGAEGRTLTLELFYDITETDIEDVRTETNKIVALTRIPRNKENPHPPVVKITWGNSSSDKYDFPFVGVVSQLTQRFTLFRANGMPVRATLNVTFKEFLDVVADKHETDPEFTTRLVKRGDTLSNIAAEAYRDCAKWRIIAEANQLDDPRHLEVGSRLALPKLG